MEDDVKQSSADRYAVSQAYRWKAERDAARQELRQLKEEVEGRLMPEGMEWLLDVWPKWSNGDYCKFGDWWKSDKYGETEPKKFLKLAIYSPEQLREWNQDDGDHFGYEWDFMRPANPRYRPDKVELPSPKVLDADGVEIELGDDLYSVEGGIKLHVDCICRTGKIASNKMAELDKWTDPKMYTHRAPVLAADGKPLREGDEVWKVKHGSGPYHVQEVRDGVSVCVAETHREFRPDELTHERPVLDAEGNRIEPAMDVWWICEGDERGIHAEKLHVERVDKDGMVTCDPFNHGTWVELEPSELYVNKPVLDADGVPIKVGDTVYEVGENYPPFIVDRLPEPGAYRSVKVTYPSGAPTSFDPERLTHTKPELGDSWERIEEDARLEPPKYTDKYRIGRIGCDAEDMRVDLVRRCKELAGDA